MAGFSNEFLGTVSVTRRGRTRVVTCPKCKTILAEQQTGEEVTPQQHSLWLRAVKGCTGDPDCHLTFDKELAQEPAVLQQAKPKAKPSLKDRIMGKPKADD